jgi:methionine biosynthesis protein MetW
MKRSDFYDIGYYAGLMPEPRFTKVLTILSTLKGERLLDVGCGDGTFTLLMKNAMKAEEVAGIEIAPDAVATASKKGIKVYNIDIDESPFPFDDAYFDVIYCGEIIEHVFNTDHLLEEVYRVLKLDGTAIFTTPNLAGWPNRLALLLGYQPYPTAVSPKYEGIGKLFFKGDEGQWGHIRVFTVRALKELLYTYHFKIIGLIGCQVSIKTTSTKFLTQLILLLDKIISRIPSLSNRIMAVVRKDMDTGGNHH